MQLRKLQLLITCVFVKWQTASGSSDRSDVQSLSCFQGQQDGQGTVNKTETLKTVTPRCAIFAQHDVNSSTLVSLSYFFDINGLCSSRIGLEKHVKLASSLGDLYCCDADRCNTRDKISDTLMTNNTCFIGTALLNGTKAYNVTGSLSVCRDNVCISERQFHGALDPNFVIYRCGTPNYCLNITNTCENFTDTSGTITEKCCCSGSACNKPAPILPPVPQVLVPHMVPMLPGLLPPTEPSTVYIGGGIIAALLFCVLLSIVVFNVVRWFQRRQQEHFSYIYSQLTADLTEELSDKDDDRMLVP